MSNKLNIQIAILILICSYIFYLQKYNLIIYIFIISLSSFFFYKLREIETNFNNEIKTMKKEKNILYKNIILNEKEFKYQQFYYKAGTENEILKLRGLINSYKNKLNRLLNSNKVLYFRKLASFLYEQLVNNIDFKKSPENFTNYLRPNPLNFNLLYIDKSIKGIEAKKINVIIDYINFIRDECSLIIHLNKKNLIEKDVYLNYIKYGSFYQDIKQENKENEKNKDEKVFNNISIKNKENQNNNIEQIEEDEDIITIKDLCSYLFATENINENDIKYFNEENEKYYNNLSYIMNENLNNE